MPLGADSLKTLMGHTWETVCAMHAIEAQQESNHGEISTYDHRPTPEQVGQRRFRT